MTKHKAISMAILTACLGGALGFVAAAPAEAVACDPGANPTNCTWMDTQNLFVAYGPISYQNQISNCAYFYHLDIAGKTGTSWGVSACDQFAVRLYTSNPLGWAGWSSWAYGENSAQRATSETLVETQHKVEPYE